MSGKNRDQRRKDKLAKRAKHERERQRDAITPYEGDKYKAPEWLPYLSQTEVAVYETIVLTQKRLTNDQVKAAFEALIRYLRDDNPARLPEVPAEMTLTAGKEVEFLIANIRTHWTMTFEKHGPIRNDDLIGILRTLLYSIEAHAWNTGKDLGYVAFIYKFIRDSGLVSVEAPPQKPQLPEAKE